MQESKLVKANGSGKLAINIKTYIQTKYKLNVGDKVQIQEETNGISIFIPAVNLSKSKSKKKNLE